MQRAALLAFLVLSSWSGPAAAQAPSAGPGYHFLLGRHYESEGETEKALAAHRQAIALAPASAELRAELAGFYARQERTLDAITTAEEALALDAENREANRVLGTVYAALVDQRRAARPGEDPQQYLPRAIAALERVRRGGRGDLTTDLTLGRLYLQSDAYEKAIPLFRRVMLDQPGYPDVAVLLASAQEGAGRAEEAIETLRATLEYNPRFVRGFVMLAELSEKQGQWREAAGAYERAQQIGTRGVDLTTRRAAALINAGAADTARELLATPAAAAEPPALVLYLYAAAQRQTGDLAGAEETARRLRAAAPDDPRGMYVLAQVLEARGDHTGAEKALRELLDRDPKDATALNYLGYMLAERGERLDEAVALVQRALERDPGNPSFLDSLGWAYFQKGQLELADAPLTEAASRMPNNSVILDHLGDLRFRQGQFADAVGAWERALAGDGDAIDRARIQQKIRDARSRLGQR